MLENKQAIKYISFFCFNFFYIYIYINAQRGESSLLSPNMLDCNIIVSVFGLCLYLKDYFQTNTLGKGMNLLILNTYELINPTTLLLQGWLWH